MVLGLEQGLALALVPVLAKATEVMGGPGPEDGRAGTVLKAVEARAEEAVQVAEGEAVAAGMGQPRAMGPQTAEVKVRSSGIQ